VTWTTIWTALLLVSWIEEARLSFAIVHLDTGNLLLLYQGLRGYIGFRDYTGASFRLCRSAQLLKRRSGISLTWLGVEVKVLLVLLIVILAARNLVIW
jgi:hypothetical protein